MSEGTCKRRERLRINLKLYGMIGMKDNYCPLKGNEEGRIIYFFNEITNKKKR